MIWKCVNLLELGVWPAPAAVDEQGDEDDHENADTGDDYVKDNVGVDWQRGGGCSMSKVGGRQS